MNLSSERVKVFPSTYRVSELSGKYTSEKNFVNIINSFVDYNSTAAGYTLSYDNNVIKFILHGYYFEVNLDKTYTNLWATIAVETSSGCLVNCSSGSIELDVASLFTGLNLSEAATSISITGCNTYSLQLLSDGNLVNKGKLSSDSVRYKATNDLLSDILDNKQGTIEAKTPLTLTNNQLTFDTHTGNHGTYLKYEEQRSVGASNIPVYTNDSGELVASTSTLGTKGETSGTLVRSQAMIIQNGTLTGGQSIWASTNSPTASDGQVGDLWLKYSV